MKSLKYIIFIVIICFVSLSTVNATISCSYKKGSNEFLCSIGSRITCTNTEGTFRPAGNRNILLTRDDYKLDKEYDTTSCEAVPTIYVSFQNTDNGFVWTSIGDSKDDCTSTDCMAFNYEPDNTTWTADSFCNISTVRGAFRTVGWVIYFIKIIIPIVIIVFGSIDFGKAIIASKDDEIKKAGRSLMLRAVAGIIIFFIPTIISFGVDLIGGKRLYDEENKYRDSFGFCTHCMLNPLDDSCGSLAGGK